MSIEITLAERARRKALSDRLIRHPKWTWEYGCTVDGWIMWPGQPLDKPVGDDRRTFSVNHALEGHPYTVYRRGRTAKMPVSFMAVFDPVVLLDAPGTVGVLALLLMRAEKRFGLFTNEDRFTVTSEVGSYDDVCLGVAMAEVLLRAWGAEAGHAA